MRQLCSQRSLLPLFLVNLFSAASLDAVPRNPIAPPDPVMGPEFLCLPVLVFTVLTEGIIVLIGARLRRKPGRRLLLASALANCITVTALTVYLALIASIAGSAAEAIALLVAAELAIWLFEAFFLRRYPGTQVSWKEALSFSAAMNLGSLAAGYGALLLLPVLLRPA